MSPSRPTRRVSLARGAAKELVIAGFLLALAALAASVWPGGVTYAILSVVAALFALLLYFFRDPVRTPPAGEGSFLAAADGRVDQVERVHEPRHLRSEGLRISVFMSLLDVHVNRAPIAGHVAQVEHVPGEFLQAFRADAADRNEHNLVCMETRFGPVLVKQIAGVMARRVVCWVEPGADLVAGERVGMVKFGSRVDVFLPNAAEPAVSVGDRTQAGVTVIARWGAEHQREDRHP